MARDTSEASDDTTLGLASILVGSLPATLLTDRAPDRYTVEAVFTRRPEGDEIAQIAGRGTGALLEREGYPMVTLTVSDRRLEIANTSLEELRDGLAAVIAERLEQISVEVHADQRRAAARRQVAEDDELERAAAVAEIAGSVTFHPRRRGPDGARGSSRDETVRADRAQIDDWEDEGGHARGAVPEA